jgi:hypothetical protein
LNVRPPKPGACRSTSCCAARAAGLVSGTSTVPFVTTTVTAGITQLLKERRIDRLRPRPLQAISIDAPVQSPKGGEVSLRRTQGFSALTLERNRNPPARHREDATHPRCRYPSLFESRGGPRSFSTVLRCVDFLKVIFQKQRIGVGNFLGPAPHAREKHGVRHGPERCHRIR